MTKGIDNVESHFSSGLEGGTCVTEIQSELTYL